MIYPYGHANTMERRYPDGIYDFRSLVTGGYHFVDKTMLISEVCEADGITFLYTRPRRFGKSINLSMLDYYFNVRYRDSEDIFKGLKIDSCDRCRPYKNEYPVIRLNFGDLECASLDEFYESISDMLSFTAETALEVLKGYEIDEGYKRTLDSAIGHDLSRVESRSFIKKLCRLYGMCFGRKTIILVDEYDQWVQNVRSTELFESLVGAIRPFMQQTFKFNNDIQFGFVTGIMPMAKTSMLSSFNNASICSILDERGDESFGFTEGEVSRLLEETGNPPEKMDEIREWYDGYRFGDAEIYNPWSILNYIKSGFEPAPYWAGTSGNDIIDNLLDHADEDTYSKLVSLGNGQTIEVMLSPRVVMNDLASDRNAIYSVMVMAGYLKAVPLTRGYEISIPNAEMMRVFETMMMHRIHSDAEIAFGNLFDGMEVNDTALMERSLRRIMDENIPFILLSRERDYQLIIGAAAMGRLGRYTVSLEEEAGDGRADILMKPNRAGLPNIVLELKKTDSGDPRECAVKALCQIKEREYFRSLSGKVFIYGLCFRGKDFALLSEEISR